MYLRSNTLTYFELSLSSMNDTLTSNNEMIDKQQKEISYPEIVDIKLLEEYEVRILE